MIKIVIKRQLGDPVIKFYDEQDKEVVLTLENVDVTKNRVEFDVKELFVSEVKKKSE